MNKPLKVFITYARTDKAAKDKLIKSLAVMTRSGLIEIWHDTEMLGGDRWQHEIFSTHLPASNLLLYLVSIDSLASENCYEEFEVALEKKIRVIPIIFSDCDWKSDQQLSDFQVFPDDGTPINEWDPESKGWQNAVKGIRKTVENMLSQSKPASGVSEKELKAKIVFQHGNILKMLERLDMAIEAYSLAIDLKPDYAPAYNNRGIVYFGKDEVDKAIRDYTEAIKHQPDDAIAYNNRGNVYTKKGNLDSAISDYDTAIEIQPDDAKAYNNRGNAYVAKDEVDKAIRDFTEAIRLKPDLVEAYNNRGNAYKDKGEIQKAFEDYAKAINLYPNYALTYFHRGIAYAEKGEFDNAITDYTKAIELKPNNTEAYSNRGLAYYQKGDFDNAITDYTKAIELQPDYTKVYVNRGVAYYQKGDFATAITDYNKTIQIDPDNTNGYCANAYHNRGEAWLHLQEWEKAKSDLITAKDMGHDIIASFHNDYANVANFEQRNDIQLPADIVALLTPPQA